MWLEIFNRLDQGILICDETDCVRYANEAAVRLTGLPASELIGKTAMGSLPQGGPSGPGEETPCIEHTASSIRDANGEVIAKLHLIEDRTFQVRLEDSLRQTEDKYRLLFDGSKDMIFTHTKGGIFKDVNQACVDTLGYDSKEELLSLASVERIYINPVHRKVFQEQIDSFGFVKDFEIGLKKRDGTCLYCLGSGHAVRGADGRITGYEAILKDITARMDGVRNLHHQNRELSLLHSIAMKMNVTQNLEEILELALDKVLEVLSLGSGAVILIDEERSAFLLKAQKGLFQGLPGDPALTLYDQALMQSLLERNRFLKPQRTFPPFKASLEVGGHGERIELLCFLITAKETASGFLALQLAPNRQLSYRDYQMLGSLGNFLGSAIDNACLSRTVGQHREELRKLTARLFTSQEEERKRIARELHDMTGQALTGISFALDTIVKALRPQADPVEEQLLEIKKQINHTYQEIRRISHRLHPAILSELGLEPALESCFERISRYTPLEIDFRMVGFQNRMDPRIETILYRISQEAINNTIKHSQAKHFKLSIIKSYPNII
ncbi:MAG: PAS domain S-box protein, partial [Syntrophobacteraceae bacterium]